MEKSEYVPDKEPYQMSVKEFRSHQIGHFHNPMLVRWDIRKWEEKGKPEGRLCMNIWAYYNKYGPLHGERIPTIEQALFEKLPVPAETIKYYKEHNVLFSNN